MAIKNIMSPQGEGYSVHPRPSDFFLHSNSVKTVLCSTHVLYIMKKLKTLALRHRH